MPDPEKPTIKEVYEANKEAISTEVINPIIAEQRNSPNFTSPPSKPDWIRAELGFDSFGNYGPLSRVTLGNANDVNIVGQYSMGNGFGAGVDVKVDENKGLTAITNVQKNGNIFTAIETENILPKDIKVGYDYKPKGNDTVSLGVPLFKMKAKNLLMEAGVNIMTAIEGDKKFSPSAMPYITAKHQFGGKPKER